MIYFKIFIYKRSFVVIFLLLLIRLNYIKQIKGCFGHTTVYDHQTKSLITFGKKAKKMESTLAMLHLIERKWTVLSHVSQVRLPSWYHLGSSILCLQITLITNMPCTRLGKKNDGYFTSQTLSKIGEKSCIFQLVCILSLYRYLRDCFIFL